MSDDKNTVTKKEAMKNLAALAAAQRESIKKLCKGKKTNPLVAEMLLLLKLIHLEAKRNPATELGFVFVRLCDTFQEARQRDEFRRVADKSIRSAVDYFGNTLCDIVDEHYKPTVSVLRAHKL